MLNCLRWLNDNEGVGFMIVDNASGPEELTKIRPAIAEFSNAQLLESATNRGYFGAARFAFDHYLVQGNGLPDWVIVCNHDVQIEDKEFFSQLLCQDPRTVGVIAPRIQALPGRVDQNPFMRRRPGPLRWANLRFVSSNYGAAALWDWLSRRKSAFRSWLAARRRDSLLDGNAKRESIYAAHGSFFIFSRRYFEAGGFLDGNLFLYGEEISVAEICRSLGLPVVYEPSLRVLHKEHQSTGEALSRFTYECQKKALQYVTSRYLSDSQKRIGSCQPDLPR
jgi:GT2 family glycosyltransferase